MIFVPSDVLFKGQGSPAKWYPSGIPEQFDTWLNSADRCMTFHPMIALQFGQEFFLPNLVAIGYAWAIWPLVDPGWPLHDLWPQ